MISILIGKKIYDVIGIEANASYEISVSCFKGVRSAAVEEIVCFDFANLLKVAYELIDGKPIPETFHEKEIKQDIIKGEDLNDYEIQKFYLKEKRKYWENRYSLKEMVWLSNFYTFVSELDGKMSRNWFQLYEVIRGDIPEDFPPSLRFPVVMENVSLRYCTRLIGKTIKEYLLTHPEGEKLLSELKIPDDLVLIPDIGLNPSEYLEFITKYGTHDKWPSGRGKKKKQNEEKVQEVT